MNDLTPGFWRINNDDLKFVEELFINGFDGSMLGRFEESFAEAFDAKYAIAVNSGTSALHAAMHSLGIGPGDEVIVPPLTFIATAFAPMFVSAIPVFADINPETFLIEPKEIEKKITDKTKAIITVSLYGLSPDMDSIMKIASKHNLKIIEDNAQCVYGKYNDQLVGSFGDIAIYSLQRSKHLTSGDGGIVITSDAEIAEKCRKFCDLGYKRLTAKSNSNESFKQFIQHPQYKRHDSLGYNFRMPEICAAIGLGQLIKLKTLVNKRMVIASYYNEAVKSCNWLQSQFVDENIIHSYWTYVLRIDEDHTNISWDMFRDQFIKNGGESFYGAWSLCYLEPALEGLSFKQNNIRFEKGLCPIAEKVQPALIQLKTNFEDLNYGRKQAEILQKTINDLNV